MVYTKYFNYCPLKQAISPLCNTEDPHHYQLSDAQLKAQLYMMIGDSERTHLELIDFQLDSYTFEYVVKSLVEEVEGSKRVDETVRRLTLLVPQESEPLNELTTRIEKCLMYL